MTSSDEYLKILNLSDGQDDQAKSASISAILTSAASNPTSLSAIHNALTRLGYAPLFDPLVVIPILLPLPSSSAKDILSLTGECCSAKEVIIAIQESLERVRSCFLDENNEDERQDSEDLLSPTTQLITLTSLYSSSIPRLKLRKKTAQETLCPLISDLESTIQLIPRHEILASGRDLITTVSLAIQNISAWVNANSANSNEVKDCLELLRCLLETTIVTSIPCIDSSLTQNTFEALYPRMRMSSRLAAPENMDSDEVMQRATDTLKVVGSSLEKLLTQPTIFSIIILGHNHPSLPPSTAWLEFFLPVLITCIQSNIALDETLSILYHQLSSTGVGALPLEIITPLAAILAPLSSAHPQPQTRFLTFRLLALLLKRSSPLVRFEILRDLSGSTNEWVQMRVASVGLIKEGILEGLEGPLHDSLATRHCMETFEKILCYPNPPTLFSDLVGHNDEELELARISECLSLLYVVLLRDKDNRTGIRDSTRIAKIRESLLGPLRTFLSSRPRYWEAGIDSVLASLMVNFERVEGALKDLRLD